MNKINNIIDSLYNKDLISLDGKVGEILMNKINLRLSEKKEELRNTIFQEDKNPARIKNAQAEKILKKSGYAKIRSGEHQSIWKHATDLTKEIFPLPHHSKELSPGLTRKIFSLATEEVLQDFLSNPENID